MYVALWQAFMAAFRFWLPGAEAGQESLAQLMAELEQVTEQRPITPRCPPVVTRWLHDALSLPDIEPLAELGREIIRGRSDLAWRVLPVTYAGAAMARGYSYTPLVGPAMEIGGAPLFASERVLAGITLQGPGVFYPSHWHPAVEFYGVVAGEGEWQLGAGPFVRRPAGSLIYHASNMPHAMRTGDQPMLTVFAWWGDLQTFPVVA